MGQVSGGNLFRISSVRVDAQLFSRDGVNHHFVPQVRADQLGLDDVVVETVGQHFRLFGPLLNHGRVSLFKSLECGVRRREDGERTCVIATIVKSTESNLLGYATHKLTSN